MTHRAQVEIWRRLKQFILSLRQQVGSKSSLRSCEPQIPKIKFYLVPWKILKYNSKDVQNSDSDTPNQVMDKLGPVAKSLGLRVPPAAPQGLVGTPLRCIVRKGILPCIFPSFLEYFFRILSIFPHFWSICLNFEYFSGFPEKYS